MKKLFAVLFFYCLLVVLLLPLAVTLLFGGFGAGFPREAEGYDGIKSFGVGNTSIGGVMEYEEERKQNGDAGTDRCSLRMSVPAGGGSGCDLPCL